MEHDNVNHPAHYTDGSIEVIDFIAYKSLGLNGTGEELYKRCLEKEIV